MKQRKLAGKTSAPLTALSLAATALLGCAGQNDDGVGDHRQAVLDQEWSHCAAQFQRCDFTGTRQVRFGKDGKTTTRTFTGGVLCTNRAFGVRYGRGNQCEVLLDVEVEDETGHSEHEPAPHGDHEAAPHGDHEATPHGDPAPVPHSGHEAAPQSEHQPDPTQPSTEHAGHALEPDADAPSAHHGSVTGDSGPYINRDAIPAGDPGVSEREIGTADEQPNHDPEIGAFRTSCQYSHMNFDDPIVYPDQPGKAHLHTFFGNTAANASSTAESLRNSGNSTCRGGIANRTAYWVPSVIDGNGTPVKPSSGQFYYKTGYAGIRPQDVNVFPQGLRMIAGNAKSTEPGQAHVYWGCHQNYIGHHSAIPTCQVGDHILMSVQFPQCWDGTNLDSADHKSHMAYPENGSCPATHPVAIPEITFNILYEVTADTDSSRWRLSSDMYDTSKPGGYSLHADWFDGWEREIAETFVKNCDQASMDCHSHLLGDGRMIYNSRETY